MDRCRRPDSRGGELPHPPIGVPEPTHKVADGTRLVGRERSRRELSADWSSSITNSLRPMPRPCRLAGPRIATPGARKPSAQ